MKLLPLNGLARIQPIRIQNPYYLESAVTIEGATIETGLPEREALLLAAPHFDSIPCRVLQQHILQREREATVTPVGARMWLSVRTIELSDAAFARLRSVADLLTYSLRLIDRYGNSGAHHICADAQYLQLLPPDIFSSSVLLTENKFLDTPADWAAKNDNLRFLPEAAWTKEVIFHRNVANWTLINHAAEGGCIADMPSRYITPDNVFDPTPDSFEDAWSSPLGGPASPHCKIVPWDRLHVFDWIGALPQLREVETHYPSPALKNLIHRCSCLKRIKEVTPFEDV